MSVRAIRRPDMLKIEQALIGKGLLARDPYSSQGVLGDVRISSPSGDLHWRGVQIHQSGRCCVFDASDPHKRITLCAIDPLHEFFVDFKAGWHGFVAEQVASVLVGASQDFSDAPSEIQDSSDGEVQNSSDVPASAVPEYPSEDGWVEAKAVGSKDLEVGGFCFRVRGKKIEFATHWLDGRPVVWEKRPERTSVTRIRASRGVYVYVPDAILRTLVGPPPSDVHKARFKDGNTSNFHPSNLEWSVPNKRARHAKSFLRQVVVDWGDLSQKELGAKYPMLSPGYISALILGDYATRENGSKVKQMHIDLDPVRKESVVKRIQNGFPVDTQMERLIERLGIAVQPPPTP